LASASTSLLGAKSSSRSRGPITSVSRVWLLTLPFSRAGALPFAILFFAKGGDFPFSHFLGSAF
jgi:hypothetical protein